MGLQTRERDPCRESQTPHNELAADVPDFEREYLETFVLAYLEAHRSEVRPADLRLATYICLQVGEAVTHGTTLHRPELLDDPRFAAEVCDLLLRYLSKSEA